MLKLECWQTRLWAGLRFDGPITIESLATSPGTLRWSFAWHKWADEGGGWIRRSCRAINISSYRV